MKSNHEVEKLKELAKNLDSRFQLPFGFSIGWDAILGFIPGIGDLFTSLSSFYIIVRAALLGCPPSIILQMGLNVLIDDLIDAVPVFGNFVDIFWRSNLKNVALLEAYLAEPQKTQRTSRALIFASVFIVGFLLISFFVLIFYVALKVYEYAMRSM